MALTKATSNASRQKASQDGSDALPEFQSTTCNASASDLLKKAHSRVITKLLHRLPKIHRLPPNFLPPLPFPLEFLFLILSVR